MIHGFDPITEESCIVLILGTMPGAESLRLQQYYAYGKNQFWRVIADVMGCSLKDPQDYESKKRMLLDNRIALWDVLKSCTRENSSDSNIRIPEANEFAVIFGRLPNLKHICFNGKEAEKLFKRLVFGKVSTIKYDFYTFPSTSPANTVRYETKLAEWKKLKELTKVEPHIQ